MDSIAVGERDVAAKKQEKRMVKEIKLPKRRKNSLNEIKNRGAVQSEKEGKNKVTGGMKKIDPK